MRLHAPGAALLAQRARGVVSFLHCMNDPRPEGHMASHIGRRKFLATLGGAAAAWPLAVRAQQAAVPTVGYLYVATPEAHAGRVAAFRKGLSEAGYVEGRDVAIEYRWAHNEPARLPGLVADLISRPVTVIAAADLPSALAAKAASTTIPIIFETAADPVQVGLVASLNRPGANVTGVTNI